MRRVMLGGMAVAAAIAVSTASAPMLGTAKPPAGAGRIVQVSAPMISDLESAVAVPDRAALPEDSRPSTYLRLTDRHRTAGASQRPSLGQAARSTTAPAAAAAPVQQAGNFAATNETQAGGVPPPANDVAAGPANILQANQTRISIFDLSGNTKRRVNVDTFFRNTSGQVNLRLPKAIYDPNWDRFLVAATGYATPGNHQGQIWLAISQTSNPLGKWWIFFLQFTGPDDLLDNAMLGMDQDSILMTVNDFTAAGGFDAEVLSIPKAGMYNGFVGSGFHVFGGQPCQLAPPYVLDWATTSYFLMGCPNDSQVTMYGLTNSSRADANLAALAPVPVDPYTIPPQAPQAGVNYPLDTGTNTFENRSIQYQDRLWNVMTVTFATATPEWTELNTVSNTKMAQGIWYATNTSSDWHPAITANAAGEVFGTWMSNDASNGVQLQVRFNGGTGATGAGTGDAGTGSGTAATTSPTALTNQAKGGLHATGWYAGIALDPRSISACGGEKLRHAWLVGETAFNLTSWGSRIAEIGNC